MEEDLLEKCKIICKLQNDLENTELLNKFIGGGRGPDHMLGKTRKSISSRETFL